jgi:hypothetical protein
MEMVISVGTRSGRQSYIFPSDDDVNRRLEELERKEKEEDRKEREEQENTSTLLVIQTCDKAVQSEQLYVKIPT